MMWAEENYMNWGLCHERATYTDALRLAVGSLRTFDSLSSASSLSESNGGGGNRTPVRELSVESFSMFSWFLASASPSEPADPMMHSLQKVSHISQESGEAAIRVYDVLISTPGAWRRTGCLYLGSQCVVLIDA